MEGVSIAMVDAQLSVTFSRSNPLWPAESRFQQLAVNVLTPGSSAGEVVVEVGATQLLGRACFLFKFNSCRALSHVRSHRHNHAYVRTHATARKRLEMEAGPHECSVLPVVLAMVSRLGALQGTRCPRLSCGAWVHVLCFQPCPPLPQTFPLTAEVSGPESALSPLASSAHLRRGLDGVTTTDSPSPTPSPSPSPSQQPISGTVDLRSDLTLQWNVSLDNSTIVMTAHLAKQSW